VLGVSVLASTSVLLIRRNELAEHRTAGLGQKGEAAGRPVRLRELFGGGRQVAAVVLVAQTVMIAVAWFSGVLSGRWGRKTAFTIGFLVLPLRFFLYSLANDPNMLIALQALDGIGAGIYGVVVVLICADLTRGKGRFNALLGLIATAQSLGGVLGPLGAGFLVQHLGFAAAFDVFAGVAALAAALFVGFMPQTQPAPLPGEMLSQRSVFGMYVTSCLTAALFLATYIGLALGKVPGLRMDRAGIALVGATLMLVCGLLTLEQAVSPESIDFKTLFLLFGMMIVVGFLRLSGVFKLLTGWALARLSTPHRLLLATTLLSGILSAFLINDVVCVAPTPLVLHLCRRLRFDPLPHLIALATAANLGSTGTITGNPQNIFIGSHSGISYFRFAARLLPVAVLGLLIDYAMVALVYRSRLHTPKNAGYTTPAEVWEEAPRSRVHVWLQAKSVAVTLAAVVLFFTGLPLEVIALGAAAVMLLGRVNPEKVYRQVDWDLLVMFTWLFVVVHAFQVHVVSHWDVADWAWLRGRPVGLLSLVSASLSNLVSNVPAVLLLDPVMQAFAASVRETAWLALAMSSTFAGNLTVLGSVANLIVVENARREGVAISFWEYCKVGVPVTVLTLALGIAWLLWVHY
jgi:Na+/H+ antiporter NhaD/arsenite permease-like protein